MFHITCPFLIKLVFLKSICQDLSNKIHIQYKILIKNNNDMEPLYKWLCVIRLHLKFTFYTKFLKEKFTFYTKFLKETIGV